MTDHDDDNSLIDEPLPWLPVRSTKAKIVLGDGVDLTQEDYWAIIKGYEFNIEKTYSLLDKLPPRTLGQAVEDQGYCIKDARVGTCLHCGRAKQIQCRCGAP